MDSSLILILAILILSSAFVGLVLVQSRRRKAPPDTLEAPERRPEAQEPEDEGDGAAGRVAGEAPVGEVPSRPPVAQAPSAPAQAPPAQPPAQAPPAQAPPAQAPPAEAPSAPRAEAPSVEAPPRVSKLSRGLAKTRGALGRTLSVLTRAERLDDEDWDDVEAALISADVGVQATERIVQSLRRSKPTPSTLSDALQEELLALLGNTGDRRLEIRKGAGPAVWLVTGVNGVGKTTSIAKLAHRMQNQGHSVVLAAGDTFRAAAIDQLGTWADRLGVHMVRHAPGADPGAVVFDAIEHARAKKIDIVIADTAGRLHTKSNLMEELKKVHRIADQQAGGVSEVLLVLDATVGQNGIAQAQTFKEAVGVTGLILAKLDGSAKGGVALAVEAELGIPVKMAGVGEGLEDIEPFEPREFVQALVKGG